MAITKGPLSGVRVLDMTQAHAGPFGTMLLGDLGAEIIKLESPVGDMLRLGEKRASPLLYYSTALNRNKKGLVLDLASEHGKRAFQGLVRVSDVVISNSRAGVPERQGTDYETLRDINPRIIRCDITGYGPTGPYASLPSFDIIACGQGGILSISGEPGRAPVIPGGVALADMLGGTMGAMMVLAALIKRGRDGEGMRVETNLLDSLLLFQQVMFQNYFLTGQTPGRQGNRHIMVSPYGVYPTKDSYLTIGPTDADKVLRLTGLEWMLSDDRFKDTAARIFNRQEFDKAFEEALAQKTTAEWLRILRDENDIACGPVLNYAEVVEDPQVAHNNMVWEMEVNGEKYRTIGSIFRMPGEIEGEPSPPPDLGQHTEQVLQNLLGYSKEETRAVLAENEEALPRLKGRMKKI
jgi:crotonobetainyl-CoA:carnitine CoA-transferase CaiB-like acyl-CoA transferase